MESSDGCIRMNQSNHQSFNQTDVVHAERVPKRMPIVDAECRPPGLHVARPVTTLHNISPRKKHVQCGFFF
jgi:hypothetical protein